jgi:DNA-binding MarR family transcriptional regulator
MEDAIADSAGAVAERYLSDRDGLSASATLVLNRVYRERPLRLTALAAAEGASQSGMTQLVQRMERQGLVERWSDPDDGRASPIMLGEAGYQIWDARADTAGSVSPSCYRQRRETIRWRCGLPLRW